MWKDRPCDCGDELRGKTAGENSKMNTNLFVPSAQSLAHHSDEFHNKDVLRPCEVG